MGGQEHEREVLTTLVQYCCLAECLPQGVGATKARLARRERTGEVECPLFACAVGGQERELYTEPGELDVCPDVGELAAFQKYLREVLGLPPLTYGERR